MALYIGETMSTTWTGLSGTDTAGVTAYLNSATVTHTLYQSNRTTAVAGGSDSLTYVASSNGNYRGVITAAVTATLTEGAVYWIKYSAVSGPYTGVQWEQLRATRRTPPPV